MSLEAMLSKSNTSSISSSNIRLKHSILGDDDDDEIENDYDREETSYFDKLLSSLKKIIKYKDIVFLLLFLLQLLIVFSLAMSIGIKGLSVHDKTIIIDNNNNQIVSSSTSGAFVGGIFIVVISSIFASLLWIYIISFFANEIIVFLFGSSILLSIAFGIGLFVNGFILGGVGLMVAACGIFAIFLYLKQRIQFATTMVKIAIVAVKEMPSLIVVAVATMLLQFLYLLIWSIAAFGLASYHKHTTIAGISLSQCKTYEYTNSFTYDSPYYSGSKTLICPGTDNHCKACFCNDKFISNDDCDYPQVYYGSYFLLLLLLFWSSSVFSNVLYTTIAGCMATWWTDIYKPSSSVVKKSLIRSLTTSLGSICCGSLICAIIKTIRTLFKFTVDKISYFDVNNNSIIAKIRSFIIAILMKTLIWIDRLSQYFSRYAFVYVALYDLSFIEASIKVVRLFQDKGLDIVINDEIIEGIFFISQNILGLFTLTIGGLYSSHFGFNSADQMMITLLSFFSGFFMSKIAFTLISSSVNAIYVCLSESQEIFHSTHPELYHELARSWKGLYPAISLINTDIESDIPKKSYTPPVVVVSTSGQKTYIALTTKDEAFDEKNDISQKHINDYIPSFINSFINPINNEVASDNTPHSGLGEEEEVTL